MNCKLYKLIFCRRLGCLVAVGEFIRACGKSFSSASRAVIKDKNPKSGKLSRLAMLVGFVLGTLPWRLLAHPPLPVNGNIVVGLGEMNIDNRTLTVTQQTDKLAINWGSYDIARGHSVTYHQPSNQSMVLNRVLGNNGSQIHGRLNANGQVFLLNPNGVLFAKGAEVNVRGLVASTKSMSNQDFIGGNYKLTSSRLEERVVNQANLSATTGGYIALVGLQVDNQHSGFIDTPQGKTLFTAGQNVTLNLDQGNLIGVQIQGRQVATLLQNGGLVRADGGVIQLTAHGKEALMDTVIDNTGILQARGLVEKMGVIHLDGGDDGVISQRGAIEVSNPQGRGGLAVLEGQRIRLVSGSKIDASGFAEGGTVLVGGEWQGKKSQLRNAHSVVMEKGAHIDASASRLGPGGTVVLWSERYTHFEGNIAARGGVQSGYGGQVETSSAQILTALGQVDVASLNGRKGRWLLDPAEVTIVGNGNESGTSIQTGEIPAGYVSNAQVFTPTANVSQILNSSINAQLDAGSNVTITTSNRDLVDNCRWCNITLSADINKTAGTEATLTLLADGNIEIDNNITSSMGKLNLNLLSGNSTVDSTITLNNSRVILNEGDLLAKHAKENNTAGIILMGGKYAVGNLTLEGNSGVASQVGVNISQSANITVAGEAKILGESSNSNGQGWRGIEISDNSTLASAGNMTFVLTSNSKATWVSSFSNATISSEKNISFQANGSAWGGMAFDDSTITAKSGDVAIRFNGTILTSTNQAVMLNGSTVSGQNISLEAKVSGAEGISLNNSQVTATLGDINANVASTNKGIWLNSNTTLGANGNIALVGITSGNETGITIQGHSDALRNNISAQGNITLIGESSNSSHQGTSIVISNTSLTSVGNNIEINGSSVGAGYVYLANFDLNAAVGNVSVNAETLSALPEAQSAALSLEGNNTINAKNGVFIGQAQNTAQGAGIGFRTNTTLFTRGNIAFQGETEGAGNGRKGIDFTGDNTLNIAKGSQLSLLGENNGVQEDSAGGDGITHSGSPPLTVNNDGVLMMEGRSVSSTGLDFSTNNNTLILNGEGDTLIQGSSHAGSGVALSGVENNSNGSVRIDGKSMQGRGAHIFNSDHQISRINITGHSTEGEGLRVSGNATILNSTLIGVSMNGSGVKIDSALNTNSITLTVLDNSTLDGSTTNGKGVEITSDIKGGHQSRINGTTDGTGIGIDIAQNLPVTGTSQADLLTLQGAAVADTGTGIKLQGNNDLSNTSLSGTTVNGIALVVIGPVTNKGKGKATFSGTASESGTGVEVSGMLADIVVSGHSANGSGVIVSGETTLANTTLTGNSADGTGVNISGNLTGSENSGVLGDTANGTGVNVGHDVDLTGSTTSDLLEITGNASGESGTGVKLNGNNTLDNVSLAGEATNGTGMNISGPIINHGNTAVNGKSTEGDGVRLNGAVTGGTVNGSSTNGNGVKVAGDTVLDNATLNGSSAEGTGLDIHANITGSNGSGVQGNTANGTGVAVGNDVELTGAQTTDLLSVSGNASGERGTGVKLNGNNTLDNVSLAGEATNGTGMNISGPIINHGNTTVDGKSTEGDGVQLNGAVTGGTVNGSSTNGSGVKVAGDTVLDNATLNGSSAEGTGLDIHANITGSNGSGVQGNTANGTGVAVGNEVELTGAQTTDLLSVTGDASGERGTGVKLSGNNTLDNVSLAGKATDGHGVDIPNGPVTNKGNTTTHPTAVHVAAPAFIGNNVVINGQLIERSDPRSNINSDQNSGHPPSSSRDITAQSNGQVWGIPFSLLRKRDQILSSLEGHHFPLSSQLAAYQRSSEQESVGNISFNICVPAQTTSETTGCDEYVLGKWIPLSSTRH
ncbi:putative adhesin [Yersinia massiliensis]|uniref:two-partner secretion domain-containing protein n=1 Tax=Yersinia massiliensis TaxID=419257 RepID=UPI0005E97F8D|nr:filamentous hemagglutinin N-terminal domain-containing protein [Yersinia massiliensis]CNH71009.1 putative adhesin [Yersinia massiliensis]